MGHDFRHTRKVFMYAARICSIAFTIFAMLFGSGNVIFPLILGRDAGSKMMWGLLGLGISALMVPLVGVVSVIYYDGNYKKFLEMAGRVPGKIIAFSCLMLIGPFAVIPRCIALSHSSVQSYLPSVSLFMFSLVSVIIIFCLTIKKGILIDLLGKMLGPIKFFIMFAIIVLGFLYPGEIQDISLLPADIFTKSLLDGFQMLDLLGTIFFSSLIIATIKRLFHDQELTTAQIARIGFHGGLVGVSFLGLVYGGFCYVAAMYGEQLLLVPDDRVLSTLVVLILGPKAAILGNTAISIACLTTATVLTSVFADYIRTELAQGKVNHLFALLITVITSFVMSNLGFMKILEVTFPFVVMLYPAIIALTFANLAHKLFNFPYIKTSVLLTLTATLAIKFLPYFN